GTSFGNKDAWAIGVTANHVVGVWAGNADGEGRPNMMGLNSAAPILFDVFDVLPTASWYPKPEDSFSKIVVCAESGYLASDICPKSTIDIPDKQHYVSVCKYHRLVHLDKNKQFQVNSSCANVSDIVSAPWFVLPPLMGYYYQRGHPSYSVLPPFKDNCGDTGIPDMAFIYPKNGSRITLTKNFEGKKGELVLKLAHTKPGTRVYWYLDDQFIGETINFHEKGLLPDTGKHYITVVDEVGNEVRIVITIE